VSCWLTDADADAAGAPAMSELLDAINQRSSTA